MDLPTHTKSAFLQSNKKTKCERNCGVKYRSKQCSYIIISIVSGLRFSAMSAGARWKTCRSAYFRGNRKCSFRIFITQSWKIFSYGLSMNGAMVMALISTARGISRLLKERQKTREDLIFTSFALIKTNRCLSVPTSQRLGVSG